MSVSPYLADNEANSRWVGWVEMMTGQRGQPSKEWMPRGTLNRLTSPPHNDFVFLSPVSELSIQGSTQLSAPFKS